MKYLQTENLLKSGKGFDLCSKKAGKWSWIQNISNFSVLSSPWAMPQQVLWIYPPATQNDFFLSRRRVGARGSGGTMAPPGKIRSPYLNHWGQIMPTTLQLAPRIFRSFYGPAPPNLAEILPIATKKIVTSPHCTVVHATSAQRCSIGHSEPFQAEM